MRSGAEVQALTRLALARLELTPPPNFFTVDCGNFVHYVCTDQICASKASSLRGALEPTSLTTIKQLNRYLMNIYKSLQQSHYIKFPHLPEKAFITLAVIEKELISRTDADTFTKGTLHGHADEILKKKKNPLP